jgi:hypothetical protein
MEMRMKTLATMKIMKMIGGRRHQILLQKVFNVPCGKSMVLERYMTSLKLMLIFRKLDLVLSERSVSRQAASLPMSNPSRLLSLVLHAGIQHMIC